MKKTLNMIANAALYEEKMYFVPGAFDCMYCMNPNTCEYYILCDIQWKHRAVATYCFYYEQCIYAVSMYGGQIYEYNLGTQVSKFYVSEEERENIVAYLYNNQIWIFPRKIPGEILIFDIYNKRFKKKKWPFEDEEKKILTISEYGGTVLLSLVDSNVILKSCYPFDVIEREASVSENLYCVFFKNENTFYATSAEGNTIYKFKSGCIEKYSVGNDDDRIFPRGLCVDGYIVLTSGHEFWIGNNDTYKMKLEIPTKNSLGSLYVFFIKFDNKYYFFPWNAKKGLVFSKSMEMDLIIEFEEKEWIRRLGGVVNEGHDLELSGFIDSIENA